MPSRTRAPTTLLTAMAATVVIVAWIANRPPASSHEPSPTPNTQLAEQPLIGLGGGVTVRELTQDTPFSLVALTGDLAGTSARVRAKRPDGDWGRGIRPSMKPNHAIRRAPTGPWNLEDSIRVPVAPIRCSWAPPPPCRSR